jgi:hypothetical protein
MTGRMVLRIYSRRQFEAQLCPLHHGQCFDIQDGAPDDVNALYRGHVSLVAYHLTQEET